MTSAATPAARIVFPVRRTRNCGRSHSMMARPPKNNPRLAAAPIAVSAKVCSTARRCKPSLAGAEGVDDPVVAALPGDERVGGECDDQRAGEHANAHHQPQRPPIDVRCQHEIGIMQPLACPR